MNNELETMFYSDCKCKDTTHTHNISPQLLRYRLSLVIRLFHCGLLTVMELLLPAAYHQQQAQQQRACRAEVTFRNP